MKKVALFAFRGDAMCFIHVLLNAIELDGKGYEARIVLEGEACGLTPEMATETSPLNKLYRQAREKGLFAGACRACSAKMKATAAVEAEGLTFLDEMSGHAGVARFLDQGYEIITF